VKNYAKIIAFFKFNDFCKLFKMTPNLNEIWKVATTFQVNCVKTFIKMVIISH